MNAVPTLIEDVKGSYKTSSSIDKISEALALAQLEFDAVEKDKTNPHFKSKYASLSSQISATRPALANHGLCMTQAPSSREGRYGVITRLLHKSGQWFESELLLKPRDESPQSVGSALTYSRRYSAEAMLNIAPEDSDDDGNKANGHDERKSSSPTPEQVEQIKRIEMARAAQKEAEEKAAREAARDALFAKEATKKGIAESAWPELKARMSANKRTLNDMQMTMDEIERDRMDKETTF